MSGRRALACLCLVALVPGLSACHKKSARVRAPRLPAPASVSAGSATAEVVPGSLEIGYASWYGNPYHGRKTSSGEVYDMYSLTAAHRTLPLGTEVEVTNVENSRTVTVRINDRGPFVDGRIIDLSLSAARLIDMVGPGTAMVEVKVLRVPAAPVVTVAAAQPPRQPSVVIPSVAGRFAAQVGAFSERRNAERLRDDLTRRYPQFSISTAATVDGRLYRVWVGNEASQQDASTIVERLRQDGLTAFAVRLD